MSFNETFNHLSSIARTVMPRTAIPESIFSLVIEHYTGELDKVYFQLPPETITESKGANYASDSVLGRFEPIRMYTNSDATRVNFSVNYYWLEDSYLNSIGSWSGIKDNVWKLRACLYPYDDGRKSSTGVDLNPAGQSGATATDTDWQNYYTLNAFNQYVGKMSPPPIVKLFYGDIYKGEPYLLTGLSIEYKGPWNDDSFAALARRLAGQTASRFSTGMMKTVNQINQTMGPITAVANILPPDVLGTKGNLVNTLVNAFKTDKLFPFVTTINITLESNYPFGYQTTFSDIRSLGAKVKSGLSKVIENVPIVGKALG